MHSEKELGFIIKARMGSDRLPGKVLKKICGRTCLEHLVLRLSKSKHPHKIVIATMTSAKYVGTFIALLIASAPT